VGSELGKDLEDERRPGERGFDEVFWLLSKTMGLRKGGGEN